MRTKRKLRPGDPGTKKYVKTYGNELICIRYRYDEEKQIRYTTVELIIESGPMKQKLTSQKDTGDYVFIKILPEEDDLQEQVQLFGAAWDEDRKLWKISQETAKELNLIDRIIN